MKKIFSIICLLVSIKALSQPYLPSYNYGNSFQRISVYSSLIIPYVAPANVVTDSTRAGGLTMNPTDNLLYIFNGTSWNTVGATTSSIVGTAPIAAVVSGTVTTVSFQTVNPFSVPANATSSAASPVGSVVYTVGVSPSTLVQRDPNSNIVGNNVNVSWAFIPTAAATTTLSATSAGGEWFTGSTTQNVLLPVTTTLGVGFQYYINNTSTGAVTVESSGGTTLQAIVGGGSAIFTTQSTGHTDATDWLWQYTAGSGGGGGITTINVTPPLSTTGGSSPTLSLNTLPIANGGTGTVNQTSVNATPFIYGANNIIAANPGGSTTQIQYNSGGSFAGSSALIFTTANVLTTTNDQLVNGLTVGKGSSNIATNTTFGLSALSANTTGVRNTSMGSNANKGTAASDNTTIGANVFTTGGSSGDIDNTLVGSGAMQNTSVSGTFNNTIVGAYAAQNANGGAFDNNNTVVGALACQNCSGFTFSSSVIIGGGSVTTNGASPDRDIVIGANSGTGLTSGNLDIIIGKSAGNSITSGSADVVLGNYTASNISNAIWVADGSGNLRYMIPSTGNFLLNSTTDNANGKLEITGGDIAIEDNSGLNMMSSASNPMIGSATLSSGTVTVSTTQVKTGDFILLTGISTSTPCVTCGDLSVGTLTNATSFVINSSLNTDTRVVSWIIFHHH